VIGIVILNYINWDVTSICIKSIYETTKNIDYRIYLVDNASPNSPPDKIIEYINNVNVIFIKNNENKGYSAGNNVGIRKAIEEGCEAILIANSDIIFLEDSILAMVEILDTNSDIGIVGPKLLTLDGRVQIPSMCIRTGLREKYLVLTVLRKVFKSISREYYCYDRELDKLLSVHAVSGSCFVMSRKCALDISPFDENTFLFEEELIIGIQMEQKGYETIYFPGSSVIHTHGQSTKNIQAFSFTCFVESEIYYCRKYLKARAIEILPLYAIRSIGYIWRCLKYKDFKSNIGKYFRRTFVSLLKE